MSVNVIRFDRNEENYNLDLVRVSDFVKTAAKKVGNKSIPSNIISYINYNGSDLLIRCPRKEDWGIFHNNEFNTYTLSYRLDELSTEPELVKFRDFMLKLDKKIIEEVKKNAQKKLDIKDFSVLSANSLKKIINDDDSINPIFRNVKDKAGNDRGKTAYFSFSTSYDENSQTTKISGQGRTLTSHPTYQDLNLFTNDNGAKKGVFIAVIKVKSLIFGKSKENEGKIQVYCDKLYFNSDYAYDDDDIVGNDGISTQDDEISSLSDMITNADLNK